MSTQLDKCGEHPVCAGLFELAWIDRPNPPGPKTTTRLAEAIFMLKQFTGMTREHMAARLLMPLSQLTYLERRGSPITALCLSRLIVIATDYDCPALAEYFESQRWLTLRRKQKSNRTDQIR